MTTTTLLSVRHVIFNLLLPFEKGRSKPVHVEELLSKAFKTFKFSREEKRFGTFLAYGVLRHWFQLSRTIERYSNISAERILPSARLLLRLGMFQLYAMASVPDYAAISSTLNIAEELKLSRKTRGFINAILQQFVRDKQTMPEDFESMMPVWFLERLQKQFDWTSLESIVRCMREIPSISIRINTLKISLENYCNELQKADIPYETSKEVDEIIFVLSPQGDPVLLPGYDQGWFVVQNESSASVAHFLNPLPGETILEIGAAPGMKTSHMASLMNNKGRIIAVDSSKKRMKILEDNCNRLGVSIVETIVVDCQDLVNIKPGEADRIIIDAPCSGSGTIGKHPEILLTLIEKDFPRLAKIQLSLLEHYLKYLKPNGIIVYSTCSIDRSENEEVVEQFLKQHSCNITLKKASRVLPDTRRDGFYMALFVKNR